MWLVISILSMPVMIRIFWELDKRRWKREEEMRKKEIKGGDNA